MGTKHIAHLGCTLEMVHILVAKLVKIAYCDRIDPTSFKLFCNRHLNILIKVEANLSFPIRPSSNASARLIWTRICSSISVL